jgi:DNA polymerase III epsilon subunit-like protein
LRNFKLTMTDTDWILVDTETTGVKPPVFVVDLAAQKMRGWQPEGEPFRRLINQNSAIPREASRVHGYTREILERDGKPPEEVYRELAEFVGDLPLCSYNLAYDLDIVLIPEWRRLGIRAIGKRGFCLLRLTQRLLDPSPAGNCQLQTLRQYYRLPEHGAHSALGDVKTCIELLGKVLRSKVENRALRTWDEIVALTLEEWVPTRGSQVGMDQAEADFGDEETPRAHTWDSLREIARGAVKGIPLMYRDRAAVELHARLVARAERHVQHDAREFRPLAIIDEELPLVIRKLGLSR